MEAKCDNTTGRQTHGLSVTDRHTDTHTQGLLYIDDENGVACLFGNFKANLFTLKTLKFVVTLWFDIK